MLCIRAVYPGIQTEISVDISWDPLEFPAVTLCNYNKYRLSYLNEHPLARKKVIHLWQIYDREVNETVDETGLESVNITQVAYEAAHQLDKMVILCIWQDEEKGCREHFQQVMTDYGVCYMFIDNDSNSQKTGSNGGLQLLLHTQADEYFLSDGSSRASGFKV